MKQEPLTDSVRVKQEPLSAEVSPTVIQEPLPDSFPAEANPNAFPDPNAFPVNVIQPQKTIKVEPEVETNKVEETVKVDRDTVENDYEDMMD